MNKKDTTKKSTAPAYIVDITECTTLDEIRMAFIYAKVKSGVPVTEDDIDHVILYTTQNTIDVYCMVANLINQIFCNFCACDSIAKEKQPWYKRCWNKLKYAFTW